MKRIKIYTLIFVFALISQGRGYAQQELGLHFMPRAVQNLQANPAFMQEKTITISLPSVYLHGLNSGFSYADILRPKPGTDSLMIDVEGAITRMQDVNIIRTQANVDILGVAVKVGPVQVSVFTGTKVSGYFSYPKTLPELAWYGNAGFVDQTLPVAPDFQVSAWHEIGAGLVFRKGKLQIGTRLKYLVGLANVSAGMAEASLTTSPEIYQLQLQVNYEVQTSIFDIGSLENFNPQFEFKPFTGNHGFSGDLGLEYALNDRIKLSASVIDLGFINWTDQAKIYHAEGSLSFEGLDVAEVFEQDSFNINTVLDSLFSDIQTEETAGTFRTSLPTRIYIGGTFAPIKSLRLGGLYYSEFYRGKVFPAFVVSASKDLGKILTAGLTWSVRNRRFDNLGANLLLKLGPIVLFATTDHLSSFLRPTESQQVNLRLGLNVTF
ncbi:MAG: DUF5723 family protein [Bacteroidia bacterium]|nr:DUF5723 family protein [Bacteroidia bacterium]